MTQISVTRALAQVKALNDRIERATGQAFVTITTGGKHASGTPVQEIAATLQSNLQSVTGLISQRNALKSAIVRSNAVTTVIIAGKERTVAEAIERKTSIAIEEALVRSLKAQLGHATAQVERANVQVASRLDALIQTAVGKDRKVDDSDIKAITGPFEAQNSSAVLDPSKLQNVIDEMQAEIDEFLLEVDFALSEVNATTKIDV
ncbi:hypothetical protein vBPFY1MI_153 [Pseudomonas phage vB_PF_Y1-MI]|nr:hypothetical protein vBPFY1MI_153 [Pseudomonas phage vB_PF_Y1-MI]